MIARDDEAAMLAKQTMEALTPEMQEMADDLGVSYSSMKFWKTGDRTPSPENMRKLADLADEKADQLLTLAGRLRNAADRSEG